MNKIQLRKFLMAIISNKKLLAIVVVFLLLSSSIVSYLFFLNRDYSTKEVEAEAKYYPQGVVLGDEPDDVTTLNILLLGYGGPGHDGPYLTDAIQIVHLDFEQSKVGLISIPRDLWVALPNGQKAKINQALTLAEDRSQLVLSGSSVAKQMAEIVTGLQIDYFIGADFVGFKRIIGKNLGGIVVDVPQKLEDRWYPIRGEELNPCGYSPEEIAELTAQYSGFELEKQFECRYKHILFDVGLNKMEGSDALAYVRSRHGSAGGDFSRSQRQQALLKGVRDKLFDLEVLADLPGFFSKISQNIVTDINLEILQYLAPLFKNGLDFEVKEVVLSTENVFTTGTSSGGQFIVLPREGDQQWSAVHNFVSTELK